MSGIELSIPLSLLTTLQAIGLSAGLISDFKYKSKKAISNISLIGILLLSYNCLRLYRAEDYGQFDTISFAILCGFISTLFFQSQIKTRIRFIILALTNAMIFTLILLIIARVISVGFTGQMLLLAVVLNVYYVVFGFVTYFRFTSDNAYQIQTSRLIVGVASVIGAFSTLLWTNSELFGLLTINFLFLALIALEFAKHFLFQDKDNRSFVSKELNELDQLQIENIEDFPLTKRELEIAQLLLKRMTRDQIAEQLFITKSTVGTHSFKIYKKTQTISRADFIVKFKHQASKTL